MNSTEFQQKFEILKQTLTSLTNETTDVQYQQVFHFITEIKLYRCLILINQEIMSGITKPKTFDGCDLVQ